MHPSSSRTFLALLALASLLAGCAEPAAAPLDSASLDAPDAWAPAPVADAASLARPPLPIVDPAPLVETFAGTFEVTDHCYPQCYVEEATGERANVRVHDISHLVPFGVRSAIEVSLTKWAIVFWGETVVRVVAPDGTDSSPSGLLSVPEDALSMSLVRIQDGPVLLEIESSSFEPSTISYEAIVTVVPEAFQLRAGVPFGVELAPGDTLSLEPVDEGAALRFTLFAPDDSVYGRYEIPAGATQFTLPDGAPAGEYVLVLAEPFAGGARVRASDGVGASRILPTKTVEGDPVASTAGSGLAGAFTAASPPLLVGLRAQTGPGSIAGYPAPGVGGGSVLKIESPAGVVADEPVDTPFSCAICVQPRAWSWIARAGDGTLVAGEYSWSLDGKLGPNVEAWPFHVVWTR